MFIRILLHSFMKKCIKCKVNKPESKSFFYLKKNLKLENTCIECHKKKAKKQYYSNKEKAKKYSLDRRIKRRIILQSFVFEYLKTRCCIDCGNTNILTLDFDHINPNEKEHSISWMILHGFSLEDLKIEIDKCEIRCANCHRIKTAKQQKWYRYLLLENENEQQQNYVHP